MALQDLGDLTLTPEQSARIDAIQARLNAGDQHAGIGAYFYYFQRDRSDEEDGSDVQWYWCLSGTTIEGNAWESDDVEAATLEEALEGAEYHLDVSDQIAADNVEYDYA